MIQAQTQTADYWGANFALSSSDIEQLYTHFLETEKPQTIAELARVLVTHRVSEEAKVVQRTVKGKLVYRPSETYNVGDELVFPALDFSHGKIIGVREGFNPEEGNFTVLQVDVRGRKREFASQFLASHPLNTADSQDVLELLDLDAEEVYAQFAPLVIEKLAVALGEQKDFVKLGSRWFVKSLLADVNVGHLHLSEAILEINEGGPLGAGAILEQLDLDPGIDPEVQRFSLEHALLNDARFDNVAGGDGIIWFLQRMEPEAVQEIPGRLRYDPVPYDRGTLGPQLLLLEQELDDEWSQLPPPVASQPAILALTFPHRWAGTLPLSSRLRPLFPATDRPRQLVMLRDEATGQEIEGWVVPEGRYIYGLKQWYEENEIPVGGFLHLAPDPEAGVILLGFDRRRPQREWIRLATVAENRIRFELKRRSISCGYDDLLIVGTDVVAAVDALWRRVEAQNRSLASILAVLFESLAPLTPQNTVHAKTLYSAVNMLRRMPPGPIFAELVANPGFQTVGDHYWLFDRSRWRDER